MEKITDLKLRRIEGIPGTVQKINVGAGLQLWVSVNQAGKTAKTWYLRYYDLENKRQRSKLGVYPEMTLAKAQAAAEDAKAKAKEGTKLSQARENARQAVIEANRPQAEKTFESIARTWLQKKSIDWEASHAKRQRERLEANIFPVFGDKDISAVTMPEIDAALDLVIKRGSRETAHRICTILKTVFEYADAMGHLDDISIITRIISYKKTLPQPVKDRHFFKEMSEEQIGELLYKIEESKGRWTLQTSVALRLAPYTIVRPAELCEAEWPEIDFGAAEWRIPARRMKAGQDHIVPLSRQALELFDEIKAFSGAKRYVFPSWSKKSTPITTNALVGALRKIGYKSTLQDGEDTIAFTTHAFRGVASTLLYQILGYPGDYVELQLAHKEKDKVKAAYNRITPRSYLDERREMLQKYADYLDDLRARAK